MTIIYDSTGTHYFCDGPKEHIYCEDWHPARPFRGNNSVYPPPASYSSNPNYIYMRKSLLSRFSASVIQGLNRQPSPSLAASFCSERRVDGHHRDHQGISFYEHAFESRAATMPHFASRIETPAAAVVAEDAKAVVPFSYGLGQVRQRSLESRGIIVRCLPTTSSPASAERRASASPAESWIELVYPFSANALLRDTYRRFLSNAELRLGLLLEDLDCFAADVAFRHTGYHPECALVTASVDRIAWFASLSLEQDFRLAGTVTWTGRSAIEVRVEAEARTPERPDSVWSHVGQARFTMVARSHPDLKGSWAVPAVRPETPAQAELQREGALAKARRVQREATSLRRHPPTSHEMKLLHEMLTSGVRPGDGTHVSMASTRRSNLQIMHSQDRNNHNRIFGGMLMREAFELAHAAAAVFAGGLDHVSPVSIDDISFLAPVDIGCLLSFRAEVVYVAGPWMRVLVVAERIEPSGEEGRGGERKATNEFLVTFLARPGVLLKRVLPATLAEGLRYLDGLRGHEEERGSRSTGNPPDPEIAALREDPRPAVPAPPISRL